MSLPFLSFSFPFSFPYPPVPDSGFWGETTSTIDWCEENYVVSQYVAEAANTVSNAVFFFVASYAIRSAIKNKLETRFILINLGFALVGIGSWLFHMTLKYEYQLLDELPMIYATCIPIWSVFSEGKSTSASRMIGFSVLFVAQLITAIYLYFKDPTFHQAAYGLLNFFIILKSAHLQKTHVKDPVIKKQLYKTMLLGIGTFIGGYFLWNLDIHFCPNWISFRRNLGLPYGLFFELHGWWHVLTGTGVYFYVVYLEYLRILLLHKENEYQFVEHLGFFPELVLKTTLKKAN